MTRSELAELIKRKSEEFDDTIENLTIPEARVCYSAGFRDGLNTMAAALRHAGALTIEEDQTCVPVPTKGES